MRFNKKQQILIISLLFFVAIFLGILFFTEDSSTRTIMIYMSGNDLESETQLATSELNAIDPNKIDLQKVHILLYTGGTKKWHNFVNDSGNGIYLLKEDGFQKLESHENVSLGDAKTLTDFLTYGYENYKAAKYHLIMFNHGGAIEGAIYDEVFHNDNLSLEELATSLKNSPFHKNNRLDSVIFSTCLNGSIEMANVFKDYARYLVASEEVSYGSGMTNTFGFLNNILLSDTGLQYGRKYIDAYGKQMNIINIYEDNIYTYSMIDLSKVNKLNQLFSDYIRGLDVYKNYKDISLVRNQLYEYGVVDGSHEYDMVDLYSFIDKTSQYSSVDASKLLTLIQDMVKTNLTNQRDSYGISIYSPFNSRRARKDYLLDVYDELDYSEEYKKFIHDFTDLQKSPDGYSFSISKNNVSSGKELSIELSEEQLDSYLSGVFILFERNKEHPNYYRIILKSNDVSLKNNMLQANIDDNILMLTDENNGVQVATYYDKNNKEVRSIRNVLLSAKDNKVDVSSSDSYYHRVSWNIMEKDKKVIISSTRLNSVNDLVNGMLLDIKKYDSYMISANYYRILDENGNLLNQSDWEREPFASFYTGTLKNIQFQNSGLQENMDYYGVFIIKDIYDNISYSKLVKVGE